MASKDESGPRVERHSAAGVVTTIGAMSSPTLPLAVSPKQPFPGLWEPQRDRDTASGGQSASQLMLSVFLLLLAFFVVLVTLTEEAVDRAGLVMSSLDQAFGGTIAPVSHQPFAQRRCRSCAATRRSDLKPCRAIPRSRSVLCVKKTSIACSSSRRRGSSSKSLAPWFDEIALSCSEEWRGSCAPTASAVRV